MGRGLSVFMCVRLNAPAVLSFTKRYLFKSHNSGRPLDPQLLGHLFIFFLGVVGTLIPDLALAGTNDTALAPAWVQVTQIISGNGGKIISGVAFLGALIGSIWGFNPKLILGAGGIGIATALAPAFINATVSALI